MAVLESENPDLQRKMLTDILLTASLIRNRWNKDLKPYKISEQQFNVLRILRGQYPEPAMLITIQNRMLDQMSNASRLVDKLEKKELVSRKRNATNRRQVNILITEKGLDLLRELDIVLGNFMNDFRHIEVEEAQTAIAILEKIRVADDGNN